MSGELSFLGDAPEDLTPSEYREWLQEQNRKREEYEEFVSRKKAELEKRRQEQDALEKARAKERIMIHTAYMHSYVHSEDFNMIICSLQEDCLDNFFLHSCNGKCINCAINMSWSDQMGFKTKYY